MPQIETLLACWLAASAPLGMLVGRFIAGPTHHPKPSGRSEGSTRRASDAPLSNSPAGASDSFIHEADNA